MRWGLVPTLRTAPEGATMLANVAAQAQSDEKVCSSVCSRGCEHERGFSFSGIPLLAKCCACVACVERASLRMPVPPFYQCATAGSRLVHILPSDSHSLPSLSHQPDFSCPSLAVAYASAMSLVTASRQAAAQLEQQAREYQEALRQYKEALEKDPGLEELTGKSSVIGSSW